MGFFKKNHRKTHRKMVCVMELYLPIPTFLALPCYLSSQAMSLMKMKSTSGDFRPGHAVMLKECLRNAMPLCRYGIFKTGTRGIAIFSVVDTS